jgi:hypothetical protein
VLVLAAVLVIGVVCAIAAWFVVREAARLSAEPPPPVFDADEAYEWVLAHLDDLVAATLTPVDVRRILDFEMEYFEREGVTPRAAPAPGGRDVVVGGDETVAYILARASATGDAYLPEQVHGVLDTQLQYLRAIGAVGGAAGPDPGDGGPDGGRDGGPGPVSPGAET